MQVLYSRNNGKRCKAWEAYHIAIDFITVFDIPNTDQAPPQCEQHGHPTFHEKEVVCNAGAQQ